ncbi:MAG TPA: hypothetical protein TECP_00781 [Hyphomicrobiaceae bacterium MAG_BT-2024]
MRFCFRIFLFSALKPSGFEVFSSIIVSILLRYAICVLHLVSLISITSAVADTKIGSWPTNNTSHFFHKGVRWSKKKT